MKQIANLIFQHLWQTCLSIIFLSTVSWPVAAVESLCAVVKIEIKQELTLERQAFDAHMRINNGLTNIPLENVEINVSFADEDGNSVRATSDANDTTASFFIRIDSMEGVNDISGSGTVAPSTSADIHWLIIPTPGSGGILPSGKMYYVGATLKYTLGGEEQTTEVTPDYIFVKPQPLLTLDYFLPNDVYADDAFTSEIEPSIPFTLGVRVKNDGQGTAYKLKIESAQPKIVENKQGLLIGFKIIGSTVNNQPATPSLLVDFGDIEAAQSAVGRWQMTTTLSGQFTEFTAEFYHADELGGELTSLLQATQTHFLVKDVLVDLQGRDEVRDFLAKDGGVLRVYESHGLDTEVNDYSANSTLQPMSQIGSQVTYSLTAPVTAGFLYVKLPDPHQGAKAIEHAMRSDGKSLPLDNVWLSKTRREDNGWDYFINLFDNNSKGQYQITFDTANLAPQPPVLQFIPDRSTPETRQIAFLVEASDPNGTLPTLSATSLPTGARFAMEGENKAVFDWTPVKGQAGDYDITFTAADDALKTSQTARITVHSITDDSDSDGMLDSCEMQYFGNLDKAGSGDFDGDGLSDREECLQGTDPTVKRPSLLINEADALVAGTEATEFIEIYDGGTGNTPLDGLVVVLFNGELDQSYRAFDLDGFTTNAAGYFVIGGSELTGADLTVSSPDWLADGAEAVALYQGDDADFPEGTAAVVTAKLLDALVYDTDDADDTGLLPLLNLNEPQVNEGVVGDAESHSIGRCENGTGGQRNSSNYIQAAPTPGVANNCQASLSIAMTDSADPINAGANFSYTLSVNNAGPEVASNVQVVDTLPSGVSFVSASGTDWTCSEDSGTVTCELANLAVGAANPITMNVTAASTVGDMTNQATVSATTADSDTTDNNASEVTTINAAPPSAQADLSLSKADSADPINTGATFSYTLTVNNAGPAVASNVQVVDTLPASVSFVSASGTDWTCSEDSGTVTCELANLAVGAANPITMNVTAPSTAGDITNQATVSATTADPDTTNNSASEVTTINAVVPSAQADLSLSKADSADPINTGASFSYTLTVNNAGPAVASNVQVVDTLPASVSFVSASGTDWTCNEVSGTVTCELASLAVGAANPIMINVTAPSTAGELTNQATVNATTADPDTANNSASEVTTINAVVPSAQADLSLSKADSADPINTGASFSYTLTVNNAGPAVASNVQVVDTLPASVSFVSASGTDWTCSEVGSTVTCELANLAVGAANPITIHVTAPSTAGDITNQATVNAATADPDTSNNSVSETTMVNAQPSVLYTLTVETVGNGTVTTNGIDCGNDCEESYNSGTNITLTANPDTGWQFDSFTGDCNSNGQVNMNSNKACTVILMPVPVASSVISFALQDYKIQENSGLATITVTRTGSAVGEITVDYATSDDTAQAGQDYQTVVDTLIWHDGEQGEQTFAVEILDNTALDGDKTVILSLGNLTGTSASLAIDTATLTIVDDDVVQRGSLQFAHSTVTVNESTQTVTLTISRVGGSDGELVGNYVTVEGTAAAGLDYAETSGQLTWGNGESHDQTLTVTLVNDTAVEDSEMFIVTLSDESGEHLDSATVFIADNDTVVIVRPSGCPANGLINSTCDAQGQTLVNITAVHQDVSIANAILEGTISNHGWISNSTIQPGAELIGGIVSGYITNKGTMTDFDFRGALVKGGTLSGDIINNSQVGGAFQDVQLTANTRISGGQLRGTIKGDAKAPAWLEHLKVTENSHLSAVIISDTVHLGDNVVLGEGVRFTHQQLIPTDLELTALLPAFSPPRVNCAALLTQLKRVDLSADVLEPSDGLLTAINALPDFKDNGWIISQEADCGTLQLTVDTLRFAVQPLSISRTNHPAVLEVFDQQRVRFTTDTGIAVLAHPAVQASQTLQASLADLGLPVVRLRDDGNLSIAAADEDNTWFSARPDWASVALGSSPETGLFLDDSPYMMGLYTAYVVFTDQNGKHRQQDFYPALAMPEVLYSTAQQVVIAPDGLVRFKLGRQSYQGVLDYLVTTGTQPTRNTLQVEPIPDANGDGKADWVLIYPDGNRQVLFQIDSLP